MTAFATVDQLEAGWRELSDSERARAVILLDRASAIVRAECGTVDDRVASGKLDPLILETVVCGIVQRVMSQPAGAEGASQFSETAGPFTESFSYANPSGNMWLSKAEKKRLGCGAGKAFAIDVAPDMQNVYTQPECGIWGYA